jgi:hypothetical protein
MPSGLIKEDNGVRSEGDFGCDLVEMELHGFRSCKPAARGRRRLHVRDRPHQTDKSIGSVDRGRHGNVNLSWPSDTVVNTRRQHQRPLCCSEAKAKNDAVPSAIPNGKPI